MNFKLMNMLLPWVILQPSFDSNAFKEEATPWLEQGLDAVLWIIPFIAMIFIGINFIRWVTKDEQEREQRSFWTKTYSKIIFGTILVELVAVIFKIFGLQ